MRKPLFPIIFFSLCTAIITFFFIKTVQLIGLPDTILSYGIGVGLAVPLILLIETIQEKRSKKVKERE